MNTKTILKTGLGTLLVSGIIFSCNRVQDSGENQSKVNESVESMQDELEREISELRGEVEFVIADFNNKTFEIRTEALKSKKSIDADIKRKIIDIENQVIRLEDKLKDLNYQSRETWSDFSKSMKNELNDMKRNIDSLTSKNSG